MNDDDIADLMRSAASTEVAPPAAFDHSDVVAGSHRVTRRRRALVGAAAGVVLLAGIGGAVVIPNIQARQATTSAAAAAPQAGRAAAPDSGGADPAAPDSGGADSAGAVAEAAPEVSPNRAPAVAGRAPVAAPPPLGPGTSACRDDQDPELRRALDAVFPEAAGATEAATTDICRPGGGRGVNLQISEGSTGGLLTVAYVPPGRAPEPVSQDGTTSTQPTASGGSVSVTVSGDGPGARAPYADRVADIARKLAPGL